MARILKSRYTWGIRGDEPCFCPGDKAKIDAPHKRDHGKTVIIKSYHVTHKMAGNELCHECIIPGENELFCMKGKYLVPILAEKLNV